ncbi:MAG TPA: hypothetical protein VHZ74_04090 [Bryobacteraceae bacterium]|jgi:hypothetical protein|nr:hypothetical protein [Bryobacteraceae bacterium]
MRSSLIGVETEQADSIAKAVIEALEACNIAESRVELAGHTEEDGSHVVSIGVMVDDAASRPMLIETDNFKASLEAQMDLLRAWLWAGHPPEIDRDPIVQYRTGERVPVAGATEPLVAARDSRDNRVWVVSEHGATHPAASPVPYLIFPDGSLVKEQQHGLPD